MINYNISKCKNPNGSKDVTYLSCKALKTSDYTFKELSQDIAFATTCTKADAMAVLASIKPFILNALLAGRRVVLDDLGSFVIGVRGKCFSQETTQEADFVPSSFIKGHTVKFRPEVELKKDIAAGIKYRLVASEWYGGK